MTDEQRAELKRLAEAATPGPYESHRHLDWQQPQTEVRSKPHNVQILRFVRGEPQFWCTTGKKEQEWKNADYLAAASPDVVLDMLREHEEDQGVIAVWRGRTERAEAQAERLLGEVDELRDRLKLQVDDTHEQRCRWRHAESERDAIRAENERLRAEIQRMNEDARNDAIERELAEDR